MIYLDHTKASTAAECMRKYQLKWILNLKSEYGSTALRFGSAWHGAMEGYYKHVAEEGWAKDGDAVEAGVREAAKVWADESKDRTFFEDYRTFENLMQAYLAYLDQFYADDRFMKIRNVERGFQILLSPSEEERKLLSVEPIMFTGRIDMELELNGLPWIKEFKTTGQPIIRQQERLHRSPQVLGYNYAAMQSLDEPPTGSLVTLCHLSAYKSKKTGLYGKPKVDFSRVPQVYGIQDLIDWRWYFLGVAAKLQACERTNFYPKNLTACRTFGKCGFFDLCEMYGKDAPNPEMNPTPGFTIDEDPWHTLKSIEKEKIIVKEEDHFYEKCKGQGTGNVPAQGACSW